MDSNLVKEVDICILDKSEWVFHFRLQETINLRLPVPAAVQLKVGTNEQGTSPCD